MKNQDSELVGHILDLLEPLGNISTSRMFGGVLFKVENKQLGVLFEEVLYFKVVNTDLQEEYKNNGSKQFTYTRKGKKDPIVIKNWWSVSDSAMDNSEEIVLLAERVLDQVE